MSKEVCTGLNILKKGTDPPLRPDEELPEWCGCMCGSRAGERLWAPLRRCVSCAAPHPVAPPPAPSSSPRLWKLAEPEPTLNELRRAGPATLEAPQLERYVKLENRDGIRTRNHDRAK